MGIFYKMKTFFSFIKGVIFFRVSILELLIIYWYILFYKIEPWHITQLASATSYQRFVMDKINNDNNTGRIIDFGGGLGFLGRRLKFSSYLCIDNDENVVKCANQLRKLKDISFIHGDAKDFKFNIDFMASTVIALNFLHHFDKDAVLKFIKNIISSYPNVEIIFDYNIPNKTIVNKLMNDIKRYGFEVTANDHYNYNRTIYFIRKSNV